VVVCPPRKHLEGNVLNALICSVFGTHEGFGYCYACCLGQVEHNFIGSCIMFSDDVGIDGCANCLYSDDTGNCGGPPTLTCLQDDCQETGRGHEHILRGWLQQQLSLIANNTASLLRQRQLVDCI